MHLPSPFITNIHAAYGDAGKLWLKQLPQQLEGLAKQWDFRFVKPVTNLAYNFVGIVELHTTGEPAIIKISPDSKSIVAEMHCLQCFKRDVPKIFNFDENQRAFLMEHLTPGDSLKSLVQAGQDDAATRLICQVIRDLQSEQQVIFSFKHLSDLAQDLMQLQGHVDKRLLAKVKALFRDLTADRSQDVLLHGDLHHDNIISQGSSWKVIDPHGYIGDPVAEVGAMIRNPWDGFPKNHSLKVVVERRLRILAEELPFDAQRIKAWAYCMTILSAAWRMADFGVLTEAEIELADVIDRVAL